MNIVSREMSSSGFSFALDKLVLALSQLNDSNAQTVDVVVFMTSSRPPLKEVLGVIFSRRLYWSSFDNFPICSFFVLCGLLRFVPVFWRRPYLMKMLQRTWELITLSCLVMVESWGNFSQVQNFLKHSHNLEFLDLKPGTMTAFMNVMLLG